MLTCPTSTGSRSVDGSRHSPRQVRFPCCICRGSVYVRSEDRTHGLEEGADGYLIKPVEPREVVATVKSLLRIHQAEVAARAAARDWQVTFDALSDAVCLLDAEGRILRANQALSGLLGKPIQALVGFACARVFQEVLGTPGVRVPYSDPAAAAPPGLDSWETLFSHLRRTGWRETWELGLGERWFLTTADPVHDERGTFAGSVHLFAEITDQVRGEEERNRLLAERSRLTDHLRLLLESTGEGIFGLDLEGRCTFINRAAAEMLGWAPEELVGCNIHAATHHHHPNGSLYPEVECPITRGLRTGEKCRMVSEVLWRRDGTSFPAEYSCHPLREEGALLGAVVTFVDITDRQRLEEHLRQAQKLEAIGRLAGGLAHDFNNLLTVITGNLSLVLANIPATAPQHELLEMSERAAWRAAELVRQLLGFSRKSVLWLQPTDLNNCIDEVISMLEAGLDPRIQVIRRPAADLWTVRADLSQLTQVLMSLCLNARDAMAEGGRLILETTNVVLDRVAAQAMPGGRPGEFVRLRVSDNGRGIPAPLLSRIFDPYFTTKEITRGTGLGLGLAMVYDILQQHEGWILCTSTVGQGTCFEMYLPRLAIVAME